MLKTYFHNVPNCYLKNKFKLRKRALQLKIPICRSWKRNFRKFSRHFYDDVIYKDDLIINLIFLINKNRKCLVIIKETQKRDLSLLINGGCLISKITKNSKSYIFISTSMLCSTISSFSKRVVFINWSISAN